MDSDKKVENPFESMRLLIERDKEFNLVEFAKQFLLSESEAKSVWICCPSFQEKFCRERIISSREKGVAEYGGRKWLERRFNLSETELTDIFRDFWDGPADRVSTVFLSILTIVRIAETQLTLEARQELFKLQQKFGC